jgi:hypothetical protein
MGSLWKWMGQIWRAVSQWMVMMLDRFAVDRGGGGAFPDDKCCGLVHLDRECYYVGGKSRFTCPPGLNKLWWYCCEGTLQIGCGECTLARDSCFSAGPSWFPPLNRCSIWWYTEQSC